MRRAAGAAASRTRFEYTSVRHRMPSAAQPPAFSPSAGPRSQVDEDALLSRLRGGDRRAFAALVERHGGALLRFARIFAKAPSVAEDLVQETWLAALEGLAGFEGRSAIRTWLFRILANKARTWAARDRRCVSFSELAPPDAGAKSAVEPERFDQEGAWNDPPGGWSEEDPERLAQGRETRAALAAAIAELPEAQRAVITLRDLEGLETDEICNLLSITVTNQRVLLHRARARVREALERHLGGAR
jgi:RNA polymerase sigma-70 factor (ECF subfamily)